MIPNLDNAIDNGISSNRWATTYTTAINGGAADLVLRPNVLSAADAGYNLGNPTNRWANLFIVNIQGGNSDISFNPNSAILPWANLSANIGSASKNWNELYINSIISGGDLAITPLTAVLPGADNVYNLGSSTARWAELFTTQICSGASDLVLTLDTGFSVVPSVDNSIELGSNTNAFANTYTYGVLSNSNQLILGNIGGAGANVAPSANNSIILGNSSAIWSALYAYNWYFRSYTNDAFLENNTLVPVLTSSGGAITYTASSAGAVWYRNGNVITVSGIVVATSVSGGSGDVQLTSALPYPAISGTPSSATSGSVVYAGITVPGALNIATTSAAGICVFPVSSSGALVNLNVSNLSSSITIQYTITYLTASLS